MSNENDLTQEINTPVIEEIKTDTRSVPLSEFLEQKKLNKEIKAQLAEFQERDAKIIEAKQIEEKNFQEVLNSRELRIKELEKAHEESVRSNKLEKITNILSRELDKNNAIDSNDALKFINVNDYLEDGQSTPELLKQGVEDLVKNKSYLFNAKANIRSNSENGQPSATSDNNNQQVANQGRQLDKATAALVQLYNKT